MAEGKTKDVDYYQTYLPPPQLSKWDSFRQFIWNSERGEFLGRTGGSWLKVLVFYVIFYVCLAAFFAVMLIIFYQTLDNFQPKWTLDSSIIGTNPGLGFRPMPSTDQVESTLIWFQQGKKTNWEHWYNELETFLGPYDEGRQDGEHFSQCDWNIPRDQNKVCNFDIKTLGNNCTRENYFGYHLGRPCVVVKMNRIWGWDPLPYRPNDTFPDNMPNEVRQLVYNNPTKPQVWVTCEGENPADKENIGPLSYTPTQGLPTYYFPYTNTPGYLSPIVMVQFLGVQPGVLINIECKAWARNIEHSRMERRGSVHFELLVD